ncbi:MAG: VWA domain-containing protein [Planctomycetota bacterium]
MSFLAPFALAAGLVLGGLALLAINLLKLRRRPVRVSSTMLWEQAASDLEVNVPLRWLRRSWLLLLHALIILLLALALGRPVLDAGGEAPPRVILILDRSASMNATDAGEPGTRLDRAKSRAKDTVRTLGTRVRPEVTLIAFGAEARLIGTPAADPLLLDRAIDRVTPSDEPGDLQAALDLAGALGAGAVDEAGRPEPALVILISDGGDARDQELSLAGLDFRYERIGPAPGPQNESPNIGIAAFAATRDLDDPATVRVFLRLLNTAAQPRTVPVEITASGESLLRSVATIPPAGPDPTRAGRITPGELTRTVAVVAPGAGVLSVRLDARDALAADDTASAVLPPPLRPGIAVVSPVDESGDADPDPFLIAVLRELSPAQLRVLDPLTYERVAPQLSALGLVIFDRVEPGVLPPAPSLHFGAGLPGLPARAVEQPTRVLRWDRAHPVLRDVSLGSIYGARSLAFAQEGTDASRANAGVLAESEHGALIVERSLAGHRRLAVGFELMQTNWPVQFGFPIFVASAVERLAPAGPGAAGAWVRTDEPASVTIPAGAAQVRVVSPSGDVRTLARDRADPPGPIARTLAPLERAGVYVVRAGEAEIGAIAANLADAGESSLAVAGEINVAGRAAAGASGEVDRPRELWAWFATAALAFMLLEWGIFALRARG